MIFILDRKEFIELIAEVNQIPKYKAQDSLDSVLNAFDEVFKRKSGVKLKGFAEFGVREVKPRRYKDPRNKEENIKQGYLTPYCKISHSLRQF